MFNSTQRPPVWYIRRGPPREDGKNGAARAGVSPTTVLNLETNKEIAPQRRTIRKLAEALGVDPAELVE